MLRRLIRPYSHRQREIDLALLNAIGESFQSPAPPTEGGEFGLPASLPANEVFEVVARAPSEDDLVEIGKLWVRHDDRLVAPWMLREEGTWEPNVARFLQAQLRPGMTFVDVGANIGYFSLLASRVVGPSGRVVAVEADPRNVQVLRANLWRNRCDNVEVLPLAAWSERGHLSLVSTPEGAAGSWVGRPGRTVNINADASDPRVQTLVPCAPLDELLTGPVDIVKVDCEMTDHLVVRGLERTIESNPRIKLLVEFYPLEQSHTGDSSEEMLAYYEGLGLEIRNVSWGGEAVRWNKQRFFEEAKSAHKFEVVLSKH